MKNSKWILELRIRLGRWLVNRIPISIPQSKVFEFYRAKQWGILVDIPDEIAYDSVIKFGKQLRAEGKKVMIFGYLGKESLSFTPMKTVDFDFITQDELSFTFLPQTRETREFESRKFDLLVIFNESGSVPVEAIARISNAQLKVCTGTHQHEYCQLYIQLKAKAAIQESLNHLIHYLKMMDQTP
jgi:hypothetical protein